MSATVDSTVGADATSLAAAVSRAVTKLEATNGPVRPAGPDSHTTSAYAELVEGAGAGHDASGHLELRDLSPADDRAAPFDAPDADPLLEVLDGPQGVTWGERLEAAGVSPFLRRHRSGVRSVLAAACVLGLVAGALTAYSVNRPPDDDGVLAVDVWETTAAPWAGYPTGPGGYLEMSYSLAPKRVGDSLRLLGLVGPGIRASAGSESVTQVAGRPGEHHLAVLADCDDPALRVATATDYHLEVVRTDALGRATTGLIELPEASGVNWQTSLGRSCVAQWFGETITTESVEVSIDSAAAGIPALALDVRLRSTYPGGVLVGYVDPARFYWGFAPMDGTANSARVEAGGKSALALSLPVYDCREAATLASRLSHGVELEGRVWEEGEAYDLNTSVGGRFSLGWSTEVGRRIEAALTTACTDAPAVTVGVSAARPGTNLALSAPLVELGPAITVVRVGLLVSSPASLVTALDPTSPAELAQGSPVYFTTASAAFHGGAAHVTIDWATTCGPEDGPPTVQLVLTSRGHRYPAQVRLADVNLTRAFLRTCGLIWTEDLGAAGWPDPRWRSRASGR
jgi:hypothetical protein